MGLFGGQLRAARAARGMSLAQLATLVHYDKGYLSRIENGYRSPSAELARQCDLALAATGELIAAAALDLAAARDTGPTQTGELVDRLRCGDVGPGTVAALQATVESLCCRYAHDDAVALAAEGRDWLREVGRLLRRPVGLAAHRELLVAAGWLALLVGCLEYDQGRRAAAEATRAAAAGLGAEAEAGAIMGWACEMSAWFALTQGRYRDAVDACTAGLAVAGRDGVAVQLLGQQAKALARLGDPARVPAVLDRGVRLLSVTPIDARTDNHFTVDPAKWQFLEMDAYRMAGADAAALQRAAAVVSAATGADGRDRSPMRVAEARLTVAVVAARAGELDTAVGTGTAAFGADRRSLPSLLLVAGELDAELTRRWPTERAVADYRAALRALSA